MSLHRRMISPNTNNSLLIRNNNRPTYSRLRKIHLEKTISNNNLWLLRIRDLCSRAIYASSSFVRTSARTVQVSTQNSLIKFHPRWKRMIFMNLRRKKRMRSTAHDVIEVTLRQMNLYFSLKRHCAPFSRTPVCFTMWCEHINLRRIKKKFVIRYTQLFYSCTF